jgi:mono/diheme cytochrome c family protein
VLARTISLELEPGEPASRRRVETQVLHLEAGAWRPYSYLWNDEQDDAELVDAVGASRLIRSSTKAGSRAQTYRVHARSECVLCHNPWVEKKTTAFGIQSASPLGVTTPQLNKECTDSKLTRNQLMAFREAGLLAWTPDPAKLPRLVDPYDESADLESRARSYLQTNCAHCHQFNAGGSANISLGFEVPLQATQTIGIRPIQGTFGISAARIIAPGDPAGSVLYYRISKLGAGRMPRVGSNQVDERATRMIHDWIARMPRSADPAETATTLSADDRDAFESLRASERMSPAHRMKAVKRLAGSSRGALLLLGLVDRAPRSSPLRNEISAIARSSPYVEVRDLFERFIPIEERVKRLGDAIDRTSILALSGDAARGRSVFASNTAVSW